jgi:hypothetical protein
MNVYFPLIHLERLKRNKQSEQPDQTRFRLELYKCQSNIFNLLDVYNVVVVIIGSAVLVRTLAALHRRFRNLVKKLRRTPLDE